MNLIYFCILWWYILSIRTGIIISIIIDIPVFKIISKYADRKNAIMILKNAKNIPFVK